MDFCTLTGSSSLNGGGACHNYQGSMLLSNCTLVNNAAEAGPGGHYLAVQGTLTATNTIFAFSPNGEAISCSEVAPVSLTCCNIHGNAGGDWVSCIDNQYGANGNISEDPLFCNRVGGEYQLEEGSSCAPYTPPNAECDLIGAWPIGCVPTSGIVDNDCEPKLISTSWGSIKARHR